MSNRQKIIQVSFDYLTASMIEGVESHTRCVKGLPPDAKLIRVFQEPSRWDGEKTLFMVYASDEWPECHEGYALETITPPIFERITQKETT